MGAFKASPQGTSQVTSTAKNEKRVSFFVFAASFLYFSLGPSLKNGAAHHGLGLLYQLTMKTILYRQISAQANLI